MVPQHPLSDQEIFEDEVFKDLELPKSDLSGKEFIRCTFERIRFQETTWKGGRLDECVFDGCDLTRMRPAKMVARGVEFLNCRLTGVDWSDVGLNPTLTFVGCNLQYASFVNVNLTRTRFTQCRLVEVNFVDSRLVESEFADTDLSGSRFEQCDARQADFTRAHGLFLDPTRNKVKDARISLAAAVTLAASFGMKVSGFDN